MSRDRTIEDTFYMGFTTRAFATGIPGTLGGTPVISAYENADSTEITAGITLGVDHDSRVGYNKLTIVATVANGYEAEKDYDLVITTGTVGGVSVVGEVVGEFSLNLSAAYRRLVTSGAGVVLRTGTLQAGSGANTAVLDSGASSIDDFYNHAVIVSEGQERIIADYAGGSRTATVTPAWITTPSTVTFDIFPGLSHAETIGGGYEGGAVWYDSVNGTAGTDLYVNGTIDNPSNSITDVRTLLDALGLIIVHSLPGSSAVLTQTWSNYEFIGAGYSIDLSGEDVSGCRFFNGSIFGIGTGSSRIVFRDCIHLSPLTISTANWIGCNWSTTVTLSSTGNYTVTNTVGTNAVLNFGAAVGNTNVNLHNWSGNIQIEAMGDTGTDTLFANMNGVFTEGTCTGGTVDIHGIYDTVGITNLTLTETRSLTAAEVNTEVDTALADVNLDHIVGTATGIPAVPAGTFLDQIMDDGTATFNRTTDSLQALRDRGDTAWTTGAGGSNPFVLQNTTIATLASQVSFTLTTGSSDDGAYRNMLIVVEDSATATQKAVGVISAYTGSSLTVTLREDPGIFTMAVGDTVDVLAVSPDILAILADTNELQSDNVPGLIAGLNDLSAVQVNTEVDAGLADYDGPTNAEMIARTLLAAEYFDPAADTVVNVTNVATLTGHTAQTGDNFVLANGASGFVTTKTDTAAILIDTNSLDGTKIPDTISLANINAEVLDVMDVDTFAEPGQTAPPATASIFRKINHIYKKWRNEMDNDGVTNQFYADNGVTVDQKQATSASGGTVTVGKIVSGP